MKLSILCFSIMLIATSTFAGSVTNSSNSKILSLECLKIENDKCIENEILLTNMDTNEKTILARVAINPITNRADQLVLREKIQELKLFPLSIKAYDGEGGILPNFGLGVVGAGLGFVVLSTVEASLTPVGLGLAAAGVVIVASPAIADTVSLPVRALIKGIKIQRANVSEIYAFDVLKNLLADDESVVELNNIRFNRVVKAFKEIGKIH